MEGRQKGTGAGQPQPQEQQATPGLGRAKAFQQTMNWLIDQGAYTDPATQKVIFSYAHPIFWAPFSLIGDGGR